MQKVKIVSKLGLFLMSLLIVSCTKKDKNDDIRLLELLLKDVDSKNVEDSIFLNSKATHQEVLNFFTARNRKDTVFHFKSNTDKTHIDDSLFVKYDTVIHKAMKITKNNYLMYGKGIDKKVESFLKDSFSFKSNRTFVWTKPTSLKNIFIRDTVKEGKKSIKISSPTYNIAGNKAIIFKLEQSSKNFARNTIYFLCKENKRWNIMYQESRDMFLDLRIKYIE